jgi:Bacteriocin-protection, YdeI or OmpD-Associated
MNSLANKLQFKPGKTWLFYNAPNNYLEALGELPDGAKAKFELTGRFDGLQIFVTDSNELKRELRIIAPLLTKDTVFWVTYPKKISGMTTDLDMMNSWDESAKYGLRVVASIAVDDKWTARRLRPIELANVSEFRNEAVKNNEYGSFIDQEKRTITLPPDLHEKLNEKPAAMTFYESLSFTNKKEYVVWILSAKQEATRTDRLIKAVEKLLSGKKNPSEK